MTFFEIHIETNIDSVWFSHALWNDDLLWWHIILQIKLKLFYKSCTFIFWQLWFLAAHWENIRLLFAHVFLFLFFILVVFIFIGVSVYTQRRNSFLECLYSFTYLWWLMIDEAFISIVIVWLQLLRLNMSTEHFIVWESLNISMLLVCHDILGNLQSSLRCDLTALYVCINRRLYFIFLL